MTEKIDIKINLEEVETLAEVAGIIHTISCDGGSMNPFEFELGKKLQKIVFGTTSEKSILFGVPCKTVDRIDKQRVKKGFHEHLEPLFNLAVNREPLARFYKELGLEE